MKIKGSLFEGHYQNWEGKIPYPLTNVNLKYLKLIWLSILLFRTHNSPNLCNL